MRQFLRPRYSIMQHWLVVLLFILLALAAYVAAGVVFFKAAAYSGGAETEAHPLGNALGEFVRGLDLEKERVGARTVGGTSDKGTSDKGTSDKGTSDKSTSDKGTSDKGTKKRWTEHATYADLISSGKKGVAEYEQARHAAMQNPDYDWAPVLAKVNPLLADNHEYIGIVNLEADGRTLRLDGLEASPVKAGTAKDGITFASVPAAMVEKWARRPALFLFHTHPADPRGSPLPSTHDISTSIYFSSINWAINVVISRYGVFMYGANVQALETIHASKNFTLAVANFSHDVVAAHQSMRSWGPHTLADHIDFYRRYRMYCYVWPTSEAVSKLGNPELETYDLLSPIDHEIIETHRDIGRNAVQSAAPRQKIPKKFHQKILGFD